MLLAQSVWDKGRKKKDKNQLDGKTMDRIKKKGNVEKTIWSETRSKIWSRKKVEKKCRSVREKEIQWRKLGGNLQGN